jgi:hypothetical protein
MADQERLNRRELFKRAIKYGTGAVVTVGVGGAIIVGITDVIHATDAPGNARVEALNKLAKSHDLVDLKKIPGFEVSGNFNGSFFLFGGSVDGVVAGNTASFVEFAWQTDPETTDYFITQIPVEKTQFHTVDKEVNPSVRFAFDEDTIRYDQSINPNNPNDFIKDVQIAIFTLSKKDFSQLQ